MINGSWLGIPSSGTPFRIACLAHWAMDAPVNFIQVYIDIGKYQPFHKFINNVIVGFAIILLV